MNFDGDSRTEPETNCFSIVELVENAVWVELVDQPNSISISWIKSQT